MGLGQVQLAAVAGEVGEASHGRDKESSIVWACWAIETIPEVKKRFDKDKDTLEQELKDLPRMERLTQAFKKGTSATLQMKRSLR